MVELGSCLNFPAEALPGHRRRPVRADELQNHEAIHPPMQSLVHSAHTSLSQSFQEQVRSQRQLRAAAGKKLVNLVSSKPFSADQHSEEFRGFAELGLQVWKLLQLVGFQKLMALDGVDQR